MRECPSSPGLRTLHFHCQGSEVWVQSLIEKKKKRLVHLKGFCPTIFSYAGAELDLIGTCPNYRTPREVLGLVFFCVCVCVFSF